jgi:DNA modification methylase|tara:strand:+ start:790 stop:1248 length:459 start_codon:yes stop_codon:yes gene_type:complete
MFRCGSEVIRDDKEFQKYKGELDICFTSPPYFDNENYSDDKTQSIHSFTTYKDWLSGFLNPTIQTCYDYLKPNRYMIINISDIKVGSKEYIPLESDTITIALKNGFHYIGKVGMVMSRSIGLNPKEVKNNWFDESTMKDYKIEPIFFFKKES